ncbi:hypothetical protein FB451DRAFT_1417264 [Mycena latifolia]|nr:hypothetical protein FB451DRAFT_1417264 [Mycena latifolia]
MARRPTPRRWSSPLCARRSKTSSSQVTQLNGKLVKSYDRVSDLEDDLHMASAQARQSTLKISQLELERTQHLSALNTGLLVEKSHVTAELTRLMEKATDEAAQRGQAESAKADIEKDLDDLSATLFAQANTMVAEARYSQAMTERKVEQAETALKGAEEMVGIMQQQMQTLQAEKDEQRRKHGKCRWSWERASGWTGGVGAAPSCEETRLLSSHLPYQEFLMFGAHLRSVHPSSLSPACYDNASPHGVPGAIASEDSEPTVRLDLAPSLNWLSAAQFWPLYTRANSAIEPMSSSALLSESSANTAPTAIYPGLNSSNNNISCALCAPPSFHPRTVPPSSASTPHPSQNNTGANNSWSASVLKKTLAYTSTNGSPTPLPARCHAPRRKRCTSTRLRTPADLYLPHRGAAPSPAAHEPPRAPPALPSCPPSGPRAPPRPHAAAEQHPTNLSLNALTQSASASTTIYPLCTSGGASRACARRARCGRSCARASSSVSGTGTGPPPVPPRRRGLWGMASKLGERAVSWSGEGSKEKEKEKEKDKKVEEKGLPTPPPIHPTISAPSRSSTPAPPLPKRSEGRRQSVLPPARSASPAARAAQPAPGARRPCAHTCTRTGSAEPASKPAVPAPVHALRRTT